MKKKLLFYFFMMLSASIFATPNPNTLIVGHVHSGTTYLSFINISIKGTTIGTVTDNSGYFHIENIPEGTYTLVASSIGYKTEEKTIIVEAGEQIDINFNLTEDAVSLDQVVVSASRNEVNRKDAVTIVNTITPELFENTNSVCLAEGLSFQSGLRVETNCQNCGFQQVRINGLDGPYSQILINSRAIFSALSGVYGIEQIPSSMIERVEIVRGGGSALFGSNAIAGTINIITKEPLYNSFRISTSASMIKKNSTEQNLNINTSLVSDDRKTGILMFGSLRHRNPYDADGDSFSEIGKLDNGTFGFRMFYKPSHFTKFIVEYHHLNEFRRGGNKFDLQPHETDITEQIRHNINSGGITYNLFSKNYKSKFSLYTSAQHTKRDSYYGAQEDMNAYGHTLDLAWVTGSQYSHDFSKFIFSPSTFTTGLEYQNNALHDEMPGYNRDLQQDVRILGFFVQNEWKINNFSFSAGARADKHNLVKKLIISPRANMLYKISDDISTRLSYSRGFRAPQAFDEDLHILAVGGEVMLIQNAENLKTETSNSYSGSVDFNTSFSGIQSNFILESFYTELIDVFVTEEIGTDAQGNKLVERRNGSGAKVYGINAEGRIAFTSNFQVQIGFTSQKSLYINAEQWAEDETTAPTRKMLRTPDNYGYFTITGKPAKTINLTFSGVYTGKMYVPHYAGYILNDVLEETPDFTELNFKAAKNFKLGKELQIQVNGGVQNILNSYQSDFDSGTFRDAGYIYGPSRPRTFFIGLKIGTNL